MTMVRDFVNAISAYLRPNMTQQEASAALDGLADKRHTKLEWRTSIVDLLKLLDLDSSLETRKKMAIDLGYIGNFVGTAEDNIWLHNAVIKELANRSVPIPTT